MPGGQYLHSSSSSLVLPFDFKTQGLGAQTLQSEDWLWDLFMIQGLGAHTLQSESDDLLLVLLITQGPGAHSLQAFDSSGFLVFRVQGWGAHTLNKRYRSKNHKKDGLQCNDVAHLTIRAFLLLPPPLLRVKAAGVWNCTCWRSHLSLSPFSTLISR